MSKDWDHKDEWHMRGGNFLVVVKRHSVYVSNPMEGSQRWAVYAYVYPGHPHFAKFLPDGAMHQDACSVMPLHSYPSYFRAHWDRETEAYTSMQVGADYHHLHDDRFAHYATRQDAYEVFADAQRLFDWLEAKWQEAPKPAAPTP